jgi:phosphotransferase system enzyme I (PtsP)
MPNDHLGSARGPSLSAPRRLLARVRDVMAGPGAAQDRLDKIVKFIAADMVAEVCSVYVRRPGDVLELFSTQGLKPSAVHTTRLQVGEGIIGDIADKARPFALSDAQEHPNFAYRPETGEEIYHSMMGVPVLHGGRVNGVVAVQNRTQRQYSDEEVETLQTVAMVLAELIASGELGAQVFGEDGESATAKPVRLDGIALSAGLGMGNVVLHAPNISVDNLVAENPDVERTRLDQAITEMHGAIDDLLDSEQLANSGEHTDVLETYRLIAEDAGWLRRIEAAINTGLSAEAAVQKVQNDIRARMSQMTDPYLRERVHDLDDLAMRLMTHLRGTNGGALVREIPENTILVARSMGPAQLLDYDHERLKGLVLEEGSVTSHVAIIARALDIPVLAQVHNVFSRVDEGDLMIADADHNQIFARPTGDVHQAFLDSIKLRQEQVATYAQLRDEKAITTDGVEVELNINAGLMIDLANLDAVGADGVGLFRTEIAFMVRSKLPGVDEQTRLYTNVLDEAGDKPLIFRTLDIGSDKVLPYLQSASEDNPSMGWRAIRLSLDRPALLRQQLRAMIRAAAGRELCVMFPMIAEFSEFEEAHGLLQIELERERGRDGKLPKTVKVGAMLEVPSLAFQLPTLCELADFVSVGSNDLGQFLFASDRGNPRLSGRYDMLSPIGLKFLKSVVDDCNQADTPVSLCGEMAGNPIDALALIGIGFRKLSMTPSSIGAVKTMIRTVSMVELEAYMDSLQSVNTHSLRDQLQSFCDSHNLSA